MIKRMIAIVLLASVQIAAAAQPVGVVTILQGKASVVRGLTEFDMAEGMRLMADDLVRTDPDTFVRIEYQDQTSLELGPESRLQVNYPTLRKAARPALYVLEGWLKISSGTNAAGALAMPGMDVPDMAGVLVIHAESASRTLFVEQGTAHCLDRSAHGKNTLALKQGEFVVANDAGAPQLLHRPSAAFTAAMPGAYRDTLPPRYARFQEQTVAPRNAVPFAYGDVEPWLDAEPRIRRQFVARWRSKADNAAFRASLEHDLAKHPEWDPVLHPERRDLPPLPVPFAELNAAKPTDDRRTQVAYGFEPASAISNRHQAIVAVGVARFKEGRLIFDEAGSVEWSVDCGAHRMMRLRTQQQRMDARVINPGRTIGKRLANALCKSPVRITPLRPDHARALWRRTAPWVGG